MRAYYVLLKVKHRMLRQAWLDYRVVGFVRRTTLVTETHSIMTMILVFACFVNTTVKTSLRIVSQSDKRQVQMINRTSLLVLTYRLTFIRRWVQQPP